MIKCYMEEKLIIYLMQLRITPNLKGYAYIKEAAMRVCQNSSKKSHMSNNLFKELSEEFGDKVNLLDRALRHAVDVSFKREGISYFEKVTQIMFSENKPSAKEIICVLAEMLKLDLYQKYNYLPMI